MKWNSAKWGFTLVLTTMLFTVFMGDRAATAKPDLGFGLRVAGSFLVQLELIGASGPFQAQALATLAADGGAVATDTDDFGFGTGAFFHSPKHGAWKKTGLRSISVTVLEFEYDANGTLTTVFKLNFLATFDDNKFNTGSGPVSFKVYLPNQDPLDPATVPVAQGGGTFTFRRIMP